MKKVIKRVCSRLHTKASAMTAAVLAAAVLTVSLAGCGNKLYSEDELNEIHDVVGYVEQERTEYTNVIVDSLPGVVSSIDSTDYDLIDFLSTRGYDMDKPFVCVTYDDGPSSSVTPKILDLLEEYDAKATFFMVGDYLTDDNQYILERMVDLGCQVGNHTTDHSQLSTLDSEEEIISKIEPNNERIYELCGVWPRVMRNPYGDYDERCQKVATQPFVLWSVDSLDWSSRDADSVYNVVTDEVYDGAIILMHDLYDSTYEASVRLIPWLIEHDYQLVTVSEMAYIKGVTMEPGQPYFDFYDYGD